jgi:uncharacterized protein with GYD domain
MTTYFMFGNYSRESINQVSAERTQDATKLIQGMGGEVRGMYALLGQNDIVCIVDLPNTTDAIKASIKLSNMTGISFTTSPAIPVEEFDNIASS